MSRGDVFTLLCRPIRRLIEERGFKEPTEPQRRVIPLILKGKNVLLISPTATGKTEAAALPVFHLYLQSGEKPPGINILYITPLRALNRDILDRLSWWCSKLDIRLAVRHGDTSMRERGIQSRSPPEMLITTPETLQLVLLGRRLRRYLKAVRWVIVDEAHELADNKRGCQLSVALERLREITDGDFQIIGLSATIGSPEEVAKFLVGDERPIEVVKASATRQMELEVLYPEVEPEDYELAERLYTHPEVAARLRLMRELVEGHRTTLIFTNTRSTSEVLASRFNIWDVGFPLSIHHGSLAKTSRIAAEKGLKTGDLRTVVCTSSLELGIDIGRIDLVIQYNSPRQVTRLLQRVGRSGHRLGRVAKGVIIAIDGDDALEAMAIARRALREELEPVVIPEKPYDVLINQIVAELMPRGRLYFLQILKVFGRAYPYRGLTEEDIKFVARYMHERFPRLAWVSEVDEVLIKPRGRSQSLYRYFFENISMIPDEKDYLVIDVDNDTPVGILHEAFVAEYGKPGVKFIVRGSPWRILNIYGDKIYVKAEEDPTGAIPSWIGEEIPVPLEVALEVGWIRGEVERLLHQEATREKVAERLSRIYPAEGETILRALRETIKQVEMGLPVPTDKRIIVEEFEGNIIVHAHFGTLVNRTLARLLGHIISEEIGFPVAVQQDPYRVILEGLAGIDARYVANLLKEMAHRNLEDELREAVTKTGLFKRRLINVARKSGALSKYANFSNITLGRLIKGFEGTCIFEEAYKDTLRKDMDAESTLRMLGKIAEGEIEVIALGEGPTPIARAALESIRMKTDIVPPEKINRIIIESARLRLLNETRVLLCMRCRRYLDWVTVRELPDQPRCPLCGSTELGVFDRSPEEVMEQSSRDRRGAKTAKWWRRGRDYSKLVSLYGRRGILVATAKRIEPSEAWSILSETEDEDDEFFERIVEAERRSLKARFL